MRILLFLIAFFFFLQIANAQNIKMKIAGITVAEGEDVLAFETSDTTTVSSSGGGGGSVGVTRFEYVKIKKLNDASTNELFRRSISNSHLPDVTFEFYDDAATMFYQISLKDVSILHFSYLSPECAGCAKMYHQVWFDYVKIEATDMLTGISTKYNRTTRVFY